MTFVVRAWASWDEAILPGDSSGGTPGGAPPPLLRRRVGTLGQHALRLAWSMTGSGEGRLVASSRHGEFRRYSRHPGLDYRRRGGLAGRVHSVRPPRPGWPAVDRTRQPARSHRCGGRARELLLRLPRGRFLPRRNACRTGAADPLRRAAARAFHELRRRDRAGDGAGSGARCQRPGRGDDAGDDANHGAGSDRSSLACCRVLRVSR